MRSNYKPLGEFLVEQGIISRNQLEDALALQRKYYQPARPMDVGEKISGEDAQLQAMARMLGVDAWYNDTDRPTREAIALLPANLCRTEMLLPVRVENGVLVLAMADPGDLDTIDRIAKLTRLRIKVLLSSKSAMTAGLDTYYPIVGTSGLVSQIASEMLISGSAGLDVTETVAGGQQAEGRIVSVVNKILSEAMNARASDIHIEPGRDNIEVRYRIDGQLHRAFQLPSQLLQGIIARVKIMGEMDIVEYRLPQDGHLNFNYDNRSIDVRISVIPSHHGQRMVMRVLDKTMTLRTMGDLGFADRNLEIFKTMVSKPWGLVLVTGPTGSGKTTTLYAAVNQLKETSRNIMTCEDPVEYEIPGISQSQVNDKFGLSLGALLRALLRQDPDIILLGEIRDKDTAETAIRAALTGHLVLSTMHSNDAVSAIPRLLDMGIEPLMLSSALIGVTAQRLVRILCTDCRDKSPTTPEEHLLLRSIQDDTVPELYRSVGCAKCAGTGYRGRTGIHEVLPVTPEVQRLVQMYTPPEEIKNLASNYGYRPMQMDACSRIVSGMTTFNEVQRSIYFDTIGSRVRHGHTDMESPTLHMAA